MLEAIFEKSFFIFSNITLCLIIVARVTSAMFKISATTSIGSHEVKFSIFVTLMVRQTTQSHVNTNIMICFGIIDQVQRSDHSDTSNSCGVLWVQDGGWTIGAYSCREPHRFLCENGNHAYC